MKPETLIAPKNSSTTSRFLAMSSLIFVTAILVACQPKEPTVLSGQQAPSFEAITVDNNSFSYPEDFSGQPTIVFMWSTWCPYCKVLMPRLSEIHADYGQYELEIIAINAKERGHGDPAAYVKEAGYDFWTVADGDMLAELFDVEYLPGVFVISGEGQIAYRRGWTELPAGQTVADFWEKELRAILETLTHSNAGVKQSKKDKNDRWYVKSDKNTSNQISPGSS